MTHHGVSFPTRRHFLQAAAAVSATGLWVGRAHAGPAAGVAASAYAIELQGKMAGFLSAVGIAEHLIVPGGKGANFGLGPFSASYSVSEASAVLDWIMSLPRKQEQRTSGAIVFADHNFDAKRRVEWTEGLLTSVQFPKLSASEAKKPFAVDFKWQPSTVSHTGGGGGKLDGSGAKKGAKLLSTSNFRLSGLPAESEFVTAIGLPLVSVAEAGRKGDTKGGIKFGDVTLEFSGRSREAVYKYVKGVIDDGRLSENEYLDFGIDLLDPSLTKTVGTVSLLGCGLRSYKEAPIEANKEGQAKFTLTFSVERFDLKV